jgi:hypothetical protein
VNNPQFVQAGGGCTGGANGRPKPVADSEIPFSDAIAPAMSTHKVQKCLMLHTDWKADFSSSAGEARPWHIYKNHLCNFPSKSSSQRGTARIEEPLANQMQRTNDN